MHTMDLPEDLINAARSLGRALRADPNVRAYLQAQARLQDNAKASDLEKRMLNLFADLSARQRAGEDLKQAEVDEFYALRRQVQMHTVIVERDAALNPVKRYFADVADEINILLGVDFTALAQITDDGGV